ncbi:MAG: hypothetical protein QOC95_2367 [Thermoleophilaceae bacterium]|jgi:hypothetical protein|nr:hypothetical protein [Thermoleophilaceae bacterium]
MSPSYWAFNGSVRASDAERERAVANLQRHYAAGRIETEELERRVRRAYDAEWRGELRQLQRDLPFELPVDRRRVATRVDRVQRGIYRAHFACFATMNTAFVSVWAWSGGHEFWPALTLIPGGALLAWHRKGSRSVSRRLVRGGGRRALSL